MNDYRERDESEEKYDHNGTQIFLYSGADDVEEVHMIATWDKGRRERPDSRV
jgi:hypothetical protein